MSGGSASSVTYAAAIGASLAAAAVADARRNSRSRSPLREGPAVRLVEPAATLAVATSGSACTASFTPDRIGFDLHAVRRSNAPQLKPWRKCNFMSARAALATAAAKKDALAALDDDVYEKSSIGPRLHKWRTLGRLANSACPPFALLPLSGPNLKLLAAAQKAGGYRSAMSYLYIAKKEHLVAGFTWSEELQVVFKDVSRSLLRGLGAAKQAKTFGLEVLAALPRRSVPMPGLMSAPRGCGLTVVSS